MQKYLRDYHSRNRSRNGIDKKEPDLSDLLLPAPQFTKCKHKNTGKVIEAALFGSRVQIRYTENESHLVTKYHDIGFFKKNYKSI